MNKEQILREIENLRMHREILLIVLESDFPGGEKFIKREIIATNKKIREIESLLLDISLAELRAKFPQADAIYEDKIISTVGKNMFCHLHGKGKIQLCGCIEGRRLYAI